MMRYLRALFHLLVWPELVVRGTFPTSATDVAAAAVTLTAGVVVWRWALWSQIVAAVGVTAPTLITGLTLENFTGAASQGEIAIAIGEAGSEVEVARFPAASAYYNVFPGILVNAGTRVSARYRTTTGVADTVAVKLLTATGFGG